MGPTTFLPRTNTRAAHAQFDARDAAAPGGGRDGQLATAAQVVALLNAGDCAVFDSRTLHCGGANRAAPRRAAGAAADGGGDDGGDDDDDDPAARAIFYVTFRNPAAGEAVVGNSGSIRPGYVGQITLEDLGAALDGDGPDDDAGAFARFGDGLSRPNS